MRLTDLENTLLFEKDRKLLDFITYHLMKNSIYNRS